MAAGWKALAKKPQLTSKKEEVSKLAIVSQGYFFMEAGWSIVSAASMQQPGQTRLAFKVF